jgi:hypothetical protein
MGETTWALDTLNILLFDVNSFTYKKCEKWNELPLNIRKSKNIGQFKKCLRAFAASHSSEAMEDERGN